MQNNSLPSLPSAAQIHNQQNPEEHIAYYNVSFDHRSYRIQLLEFQHHLTSIDIFLILTIGIVFTGIILLINVLIKVGIYFPMSALTLANIVFSVIAFFNKKKLHPSIIFSVLLFTVYAAFLTIIFGLNLNYVSYVTLVYVGLELIQSFILIDQKSVIFLKVLILAQIILIALKFDQKITSDWSLVMCATLIIQILIIGALFFLGLYAFITSIWFKQNNSSIRLRGFIFITFILACLIFALSIPMIPIYFNSNSVIPAILTIICHIAAAVFSYINRDQIAAFLCNSTTLISNVVAVEHQQINKIFGDSFKLYRMSDNWFVKSIKAKDSALGCNNDFALKRQECIICLSDNSKMVWMPCGHLSTCQKCCEYLMEQGKINCILCKSKTEAIYKIKLESDDKSTGIQCPSKEYSIEYYFNVNN